MNKKINKHNDKPIRQDRALTVRFDLPLSRTKNMRLLVNDATITTITITMIILVNMIPHPKLLKR